MNVEVEMWAFCEGGVIRNVGVADAEPPDSNFLERVFYWGQNDFQRRDCPSVSVGDIVRHPDGTRHMVMGFGFLEVPKDWTPEKYMVDHGDHKILPPMFSDCDTFEGLIKKWDEFISN